MTMVERQACIKRLSNYPHLYLGCAEFAEILGITKQALFVRRHRGKMLEPLQQLAMGPVWERNQVYKYLRYTA